MCQPANVTAYLVILVVVLAVLDVVCPHHLRVSMSLVLLPLVKVHLLEKLASSHDISKL